MDNKYRQLMDEKKRLQQQFELLRKQYNYYNQFNFNENLGEAISFLINKMEGIDCVCQKITCVIPEHTEVVKRKLPGMKKSQAVLKHFNKKVYIYIAVLEKKDAANLFEFATKQEMLDFLNGNCLTYSNYFGILNAQDFALKYPYLKLFFHLLNEWRYETGRVTLDGRIVENALELVLNNEVGQNSFRQQTR